MKLLLMFSPFLKMFYIFYSVGIDAANINGGIDNPNLNIGENETITVAAPNRNNVL